MAFGDDFELYYEPILPVPEIQVRVIEDGEVISIGGGNCRLLMLPAGLLTRRLFWIERLMISSAEKRWECPSVVPNSTRRRRLLRPSYDAESPNSC